MYAPPVCVKCGRSKDRHKPAWYCDGFQPPLAGDNMTREELIKTLNESHERFIEGLIKADHELMVLAYSNYIQALSVVLMGGSKKTE